MNWSTRRKIIIILILVVFFGGSVYLYLLPKIYVTPTCFDHKENGDENGIDCGGPCINLCVTDTKDPAILWVRPFLVSGSIYNVAAYVENKSSAALKSMPYEFRFYDADGIFVARVQGSTTIPPQGRYAIVETGINAGLTKITTATIKFSREHDSWQKVPDEFSGKKLLVSNAQVADTDLVPKLTATLTNPAPDLYFKNVIVSAILYDENDNAINVSKTYVPQMTPGEKRNISFTWPRPIDTKVTRNEIIPIIDVFEMHK